MGGKAPDETQTMRIVYLHGFSSSPGSRKARLFEKRLVKQSSSLAIPDLNEPCFSTLTISRVIKKAEHLIGPESRGAIIGSSMGGFAAAHFASLHPTRVDALVLMAPAFNMARLLEERLGPEGIARWQATGMTEIDHHGFNDKRQLGLEFLEDARKWAAAPLRIRCPVLILHGRNDPDVPIALSERFASSHRNVELVRYEAGHSLEEVVDDVLERAVSFLESNTSNDATSN